MKNITDLSEYRLTHTAASIRRPESQAETSVHAIDDPRPAYYCMRCDGDAFRIYASGEVYCVQCGKRMRNIVIAGFGRGGLVSH